MSRFYRTKQAGVLVAKAIYWIGYGALYLCLGFACLLVMFVAEIAPVFLVLIGILIFALCVAIAKAIWMG